MTTTSGLGTGWGWSTGWARRAFPTSPIWDSPTVRDGQGCWANNSHCLHQNLHRKPPAQLGPRRWEYKLRWLQGKCRGSRSEHNILEAVNQYHQTPDVSSHHVHFGKESLWQVHPWVLPSLFPCSDWRITALPDSLLQKVQLILNLSAAPGCQEALKPCLHLASTSQSSASQTLPTPAGMTAPLPFPSEIIKKKLLKIILKAFCSSHVAREKKFPLFIPAHKESLIFCHLQPPWTFQQINW